MKSKLSLEPTDQRKIDQTLVRLFADLQEPKAVREFLEAFISPEERLMLAKRLSIAVMLEEGRSYLEIQRALFVSSATVAAVAKMIPRKGMRSALQRIKVDYWASKLTNRIFNILGKSE